MAQLSATGRALLAALGAGVLAWFAGVAEARPAGPQGAQELAAWSWPATPPHRDVGRILRRSRLADPGTQAASAAELARLGPAAQEALLDVLVHARVPEAADGEAPQVLSEPQRQLVAGALALLPRAELRRAMEARLLAAPEDAQTRLAAIHLHGATGRAEDLASLPRLAPRREARAAILPAAARHGAARLPAATAAELTREARTAVRDACAAILGRDPGGWRALAKLARSCDAPALRALLEGLGRSRDPRGLEILLRTARAQRSLAPLAVSLVPKLGRSTDPELDREFAEWMATELPYSRSEQARMLLAGIGVLDDGAAAPVLVAALDHEEAAVREAALRALQQLSGLGFGPDARPWRLWLESETRWHESERQLLRNDLEAEDTSRVVSALRAFSGRRTRRAELAREVAVVLEDPRPALRALACEALQSLDSAAAYRPLSAALGDGEGTVVRAALQALRDLSGCALPDQPADARRMLLLD